VAGRPRASLLLGSGGWIPTQRRETCCAVLRLEDRAVLIDAGTGVRRLIDEPALLAGVERLDIVLTHFHLDHVVGLAYLPALDERVERHVWGPGRLLYDSATSAVCDRLLSAPFFAGVDACVDAVHDIPASELELASLAISHRTQRRHSAPTLALRVGDALAYCTDTASDPQNVPFAAGVDVLAHEAWSTSADPQATAIHTTAREAAQLAARAGAQRLVMIHVNPRADEEALRSDASGVVDASVGEDLAALTVQAE
jgi:ribonuclease BN (tRNA processing enzyme)